MAKHPDLMSYEIGFRERMLQKKLREEEEQYKQRLRELEKTSPDPDRPGDDSKLPPNQRHNPARKNDNIDKKVYLFPESFNALRRELDENWREFFHTVNPTSGTSPAWCMVFDAAQFIGYCNGFTGLSLQMDSENVDGICKTFLNAFRSMRGVGAIQ